MNGPETADVLIVGAGPAGLSAAAVLAGHGFDVHLVDREAEAGGIPLHCGHSPYGWREFRRVMGGQAYARRLIERALKLGAHLHTGTTVVALKPEGVVELSSQGGVQTVKARRVLIATGARETSRAARFIGGTKPGGVMNTGALQGLVYLARKKPFKRPVVLGTELVSFSALLTCRHCGARPAAMIEPNPGVTTYGPAALLPRVLGIPLHFNTRIAEIHGREWVTGVTLKTADHSWETDCDGVVVTGGFRPENALLRASHLEVDPGTLGPVVDQFGRCSDPVYFAAGNVLRPVETAPWCWDEGRRVAGAITEALKGNLPDPTLNQDVVSKDDAIAWHLPQRVAPLQDTPTSCVPAFDRMQIHVSRAVRGRLDYDEKSLQLRSRPERRNLLPLPAKGTRIDLNEDA